MIDNLLHYCRIMLDIQEEGRYQLEVLKLMRMTCGMQDEIQSGCI